MSTKKTYITTLRHQKEVIKQLIQLTKNFTIWSECKKPY